MHIIYITHNYHANSEMKKKITNYNMNLVNFLPVQIQNKLQTFHVNFEIIS